MSTFSGIVKEFPRIQIDNFRLYENHPPPLACFLSHVHSDHLTNLDALNSPFVYCTALTRELLLRLEKYPHRMNFANGILESRKQTYRKVRRLLKPIPLEVPTTIELTHGSTIQVTLFDANHCTGACMFLIEGNGKAIMYTGDIRSEPWWVNSLVRNPILIPYANGQKCLDNLYLDTTFTTGDCLNMNFPSKADGLAELLDKASKYPEKTIFYLDAWTFGYEEVWVALCKALNTQVHLCDYRYRVYSAMKVPECFGPHSATLLGFQFGNSYHKGCLTRDSRHVRLHSCERGTDCNVFKDPDVVRITPIVTRHKGRDVAELGAGGGQGDLDQKHELEVNEATVVQLISLCSERLKGRPDLHAQISKWLLSLVKSRSSSIKLGLVGFWNEVRGNSDDQDFLGDIPLNRLVSAIEKLFTSKEEQNQSQKEDPKHITFPFSRHSSYEELRCLVRAFKPRDIFPCTVASGNWSSEISMKTLFGDICSADIFSHDQQMFAFIDEERIVNNPQSSQISEILASDPMSRSQKRGRERRSSGSSAASFIPTKRTKTTRSMSLQGSQPDRDTNFSEVEVMESPERQANNDTAKQSGDQEVTFTRSPDGAIHSTTILNTDSRDRLARRTRIARAVQSGETWEGLRSVQGYHNQEPEAEL